MKTQPILSAPTMACAFFILFLLINTAFSQAFEEVASQVGIGDPGTVAAAFWYDADGDGDLDMLETRRFWVPMVLYLNNGGSFTLQHNNGLPQTPDGQNTIPMDFDADGDLDIFACAYGSDAQLLVNNGGIYTDMTAQYGLMVSTGIRDMAWLDIDHDGMLDLLLGHYTSGWHLYHNDGGTHFSDVTNSSQLPATDFHRFCEGDVDLDGNEDLFLCRITGPESFYRNLGNGVFQERTSQAGLSGVQSRGGSEFVDFNHDKYPDLLVESLTKHTIYLNNHDGTFREINVHGTETNFFAQPYPNAVMYAVADYDMDYDYDFYVSRQGSNASCPNQFFRCDSLNETDAWFTDMAGAYGMGIMIDNYSTWGDYDSDGDLDLFVTVSDGPNQLWQNNLSAAQLSNRLEIEPRGASGSRDSWHTRVEIYPHGSDQVLLASEINQSNVACNGINTYFTLNGQASYDVCLYYQDGTSMCAADYPNLSGIIPNQMGHRLTVVEGSTNAVEPGLPHPKDFLLDAAYPNPFNAITNLHYYLPQEAQVKLDIFNLAGQITATLVNGRITAGDHTVSWNASDMSSGVYLCRLQTETHSFTQKIVLMK